MTYEASTDLDVKAPTANQETSYVGRLVDGLMVLVRASLC